MPSSKVLDPLVQEMLNEVTDQVLRDNEQTWAKEAEGRDAVQAFGQMLENDEIRDVFVRLRDK